MGWQTTKILASQRRIELFPSAHADSKMATVPDESTPLRGYEDEERGLIVTFVAVRKNIHRSRCRLMTLAALLGALSLTIIILLLIASDRDFPSSSQLGLADASPIPKMLPLFFPNTSHGVEQQSVHHLSKRSCTDLVQGVFDVTCMPFGYVSQPQGIAKALYAGWVKNGKWRYFESTPSHEPQNLFEGEVYLEYADVDVTTMDERPRTEVGNCFLEELTIQYKVGGNRDPSSWVSNTTPWSWNSVDDGQSVLLSAPNLSCYYKRVNDREECKKKVKEIVNTFQEKAGVIIEGLYGETPSAILDICG